MWGIEDATVAVRCWRMNKSFGMLVTVIIIQACRRYWLIGRVLLILEASDRIWIVYEVQGCRADLWQITYRTYLVSLQTFVNPIFRASEVLKNDFYVFVGAEIVVVNECCNERLHSVAPCFVVVIYFQTQFQFYTVIPRRKRLSFFCKKYWSIRGKVGHFQANKRWKTLLPKHLSIISKGNAAFFEIVPTTLITLEQNPLSYGKPIVVNLDCLLLFPSSNFAGRTTNGRTLDVIRAASFISLVLQCSLQRAATSIIELLLLCYPHFK